MHEPWLLLDGRVAFGMAWQCVR
eukprot:COSAG01_NODE_61506_length_289_cov_0.810526_1_plen_22_part_01